jgi:hypothetical protein
LFDSFGASVHHTKKSIAASRSCKKETPKGEKQFDFMVKGTSQRYNKG